jgi:signal transduction histidine kinase
MVTRLLERLSLLRQVALAGALAAALAMLAALVPVHYGYSVSPVALALGSALLTTVLLGWLVQRATRATAAVTQAARHLVRDDTSDDAQLPFRSESLDLQDCTLALRRMVDVLRERITALQSHNTALGSQLQSRTQELSSLQDLSVGLAQHSDVGQLVNEALSALEQTMAYSSASVWARGDLDANQPVTLLGYRSSAGELSGLRLEDLAGLRLSRSNIQRYEQIEREGLAIVENRPKQSLLSWLWEMVTDDARTSALYRSTRAWMAVPLQVRDRVLGVLRVDHAEPDYFDPERKRLLQAVGSQTALAMRHAHLLARERDQAVVAERNRIARDLHDAVSQTLFAANLIAGALAKEPDLSGPSMQQVQTLERLNRGALAEMRMLMFELRPDALEGARLSELIQQATAALAARGEITIHTDIDATEPPPAQRTQVYRVAQEALSNVARHSGAHEVSVSWKVAAPGQGVLTVHDNGHGFVTGQDHPGHFGLENMSQRATQLGGELLIESTPGLGTHVQLTMKWTAKDPPKDPPKGPSKARQESAKLETAKPQNNLQP